MNYQKYVQHISGYQRDSLILQLCNLAWRAFEKTASTDIELQDKTLIECFSPRSVAIAAVFAQNIASNKDPEGFEAFTTAKLMIEIDESVVDQAFLDTEKRTVSNFLKKSKILRQYGFSDEIILPVVPFTILQRITNSQNVIQSSDFSNFIRSWELYKNLNNIYSGNLSEKVNKILGQYPIEAYRSIFAIFSKLNKTESNILKPLFSIGDLDKLDELNISPDTLKLTATRLSQKLSDLKDWHAKVEQLPDVLKKYYPLPFFERPLIHAGELDILTGDKTHIYLCPSPRMLIHGMSTFVFRLIADNKHLFKPRNILTDFGTSIELYLTSILPALFPQGKIHRIDDRSSKNADFIIELDNFILIIECKRNIDSSIGRTVVYGEDLINTWERILGALIQCSTTNCNKIQWVSRNNKEVICFILTDSVISGQEAIFSYIATKCGAVAKLGLSHYEIMSLNDFEKIFSASNAEEALNACVKNWKKYRDNFYINNFVPLSNSEIVSRNKPFAHLKTTFKELFPQLKNPFE